MFDDLKLLLDGWFYGPSIANLLLLFSRCECEFQLPTLPHFGDVFAMFTQFQSNVDAPCTFPKLDSKQV